MHALASISEWVVVVVMVAVVAVLTTDHTSEACILMEAPHTFDSDRFCLVMSHSSSEGWFVVHVCASMQFKRWRGACMLALGSLRCMRRPSL